MLTMKVIKLGDPRVHETLPGALRIVGEYVLTEANKTAPIEEGTLIRSGDVDVAGAEMQVSYDTPYAVVQHEDPHMKHDPGRRSHWLELTVQEERRTIDELLARGLRAGMKGPRS